MTTSHRMIRSCLLVKRGVRRGGSLGGLHPPPSAYIGPSLRLCSEVSIADPAASVWVSGTAQVWKRGERRRTDGIHTIASRECGGP